MKAMIFAAGYGSRLKPLTDSLPKALVRIGDETLIEITIKRLLRHGFNEIIINVHHFANQVINYISGIPELDQYITFSDESEELLDTGGGLKNATWFLKGADPFLVTNVDLVTDIDLSKFYRFHLSSGALVSLAVQERDSSRKFLFDTHNQLCGWSNKKTGVTRITRVADVHKSMAFNGMHIINPSLFNLIEEDGRFSIVDLYLRLSVQHPVVAFADNYFWMDVGKPEDLIKAQQYNSVMIK